MNKRADVATAKAGVGFKARVVQGPQKLKLHRQDLSA